jgi:hypothetical protein
VVIVSDIGTDFNSHFIFTSAEAKRIRQTNPERPRLELQIAKWVVDLPSLPT